MFSLLSRRLSLLTENLKNTLREREEWLSKLYSVAERIIEQSAAERQHENNGNMALNNNFSTTFLYVYLGILEMNILYNRFFH